MSEHTLSGEFHSPSPMPGRRAGSTRSLQQPTSQILYQFRSEPPSRAPAPAGSSGSDAASSESGPDSGDKKAGGVRRSRRRGGRGGRGRKAASSATETAGAPETTSAAEAVATEQPAAGKKRSRRRGGRGSRKKIGASDPEEQPASSESNEEGSSATSSAEEGGTTRKAGTISKNARRAGSRKRGSRGGRSRRKRVASAVEIEFIPGEVDELPELTELPADAVLLEEEAGEKRTKRGRKRSLKKTRSRSKASGTEAKRSTPAVEEPALKNRQILVNAGDPEETRVAVVEDGRIAELQMSVRKHTSYVSDIYRGRVVNIESAIGAAFVDFGQGRNGFLHASDVLPSYGDPNWTLEQLLSTPVEPESVDDSSGSDGGEEDAESEPSASKKAGGDHASKGGRGRGSARSKRVRTPIDKLVKKGQMVAVQITKDAIGDKGPTLTTYVSIPGRYLVLMPSLERTGVSRKIEDDKERRRLKRILSSLSIPDGMGVIVRTAGIGKTKIELTRDLDYLLLAWDDFSARLKSGRNPTPLYQESDVAIRTMRDLFTSQTEVVIVDDEAVYQRMIEFTKRLMPEHVDRIKRHEGKRPLLQSYGVEQDFEKIFQRRVELPSGGSIVLDQTEALVAIDVNSGRTREAGAEFEDIALKTNLEAVAEIARQIRLRDLGGIIVLDYIDMMRAGSRRAVEKATSDAIRTDRARSKIGRISQFGLLELTRQRLGPGLSKLVYDACTRCKGSGRRRNAASRAQAILRRLGASLALKGFSSVEVRAHPEVIEYLEKELSAELKTLEESSGRTLILLAVPDQAEDSVLHYLRADGREVRPGGRRKR